ncbi:MAG: PEP-CTERM sorting domain-containing protein [Lentisphaeria bacterium]|nr:PEP-CTERM sorting domain-containing protein [Lentisphaeria bacterium]
MTTTIRNTTLFTVTSALAACFLLSCILSVRGFGATYYWAGSEGAGWSNTAAWKDVNGTSQSAFSDSHTYVINPNQVLGGGATAASRTDVNSNPFPANNLTVESGGVVVVDSTSGVDTLTLNGGALRNYQSGAKTWGDGINDKIVLTGGSTSQVSLGTNGGALPIDAFVEGAGNLILRPKSATRYMQLSKANTHTGTTTMQPDGSEGTFFINNANALQYSTLNLNYDTASEGAVTFNQNSTIGGLEDSGVAANLNLGGRTISIGYNDSARDKTFDGDISNGSIIKIGSSTQRFTGAVSTPVTVTEGTVVMAGSYTGGTIALNGGNLNIGSDTTAGDIMSFTTLTLTDGSTITWQVDGASGDVLQTSGTLALGTLSAGAVTINVDSIGAAPVKNVWYTLFDGTVSDFNASKFTFSGYNADKWVIGEGSLQIMLIPEPSTAILAGLGLAGLCLRRRRR